MDTFKLAENIEARTIAIRVKEVGKMVDFYKQVVGLVIKSEENNLSIFGTQEAGTQLLILEETRSAAAYHGEMKQLALFSIKVPTKEEFFKIAHRIMRHQHPIDATKKQGSLISLIATDVEGNRFEIYYDPFNERNKGAAVAEDFDLLQEMPEKLAKHEGLAAGSFVGCLQLNVSNKTKLLKFYQEVLGLQQGPVPEMVSVNKGKFLVSFHEVVSEELDQLSDPHIGLDFLSFKVASTSQIEQMEAHLRTLELDFFIDKKKSILTIFDPIGIEWWFTIK
ncbi:CppA C-terminal domain-containing protein [Enterococcus faecalis]